MAEPPSAAIPSFLLGVAELGLTASAVVLATGCAVELGAEYVDVSPEADCSWKIPPTKISDVVDDRDADLVVEDFLTDDEDGVLEDDDDDDEVDDVEVEVEGGAELVVGVLVVVGFATLVVLGGSFDLDEEAGAPEEPSVLKTTMLAVLPLGTVTTQKPEPSTPSVATGLDTPFRPSLDGSMEHGNPLQPPSGHSILRPNVGRVFFRGVAKYTGFHAIFTYVSPLARVLAPATKGLQFPIGLSLVPHTQPLDESTPGALI
jgi:hypothetical protein